MIESVIGITLWTNNLENMFYFYHRILEFPIHSKKNDFIAFQLGDIRFNIGNHGQITGSNKDPYRMMPHFEVADIHKVHERLSNLGVFFIRRPEKEHWGGWIATFQDPDDNILQMLQLPSK